MPQILLAGKLEQSVSIAISSNEYIRNKPISIKNKKRGKKVGCLQGSNFSQV